MDEDVAVVSVKRLCKMNFDFLYHSYTLTITIFAAVFGMAYPLILQAVERIDQKYSSSVLSTDLRNRWQFKWFNRLIICCIATLPILAYILVATDSILHKYIIVSIATLLIIALMVDVVLLVRRIIVFYSPIELLEYLESRNNISNANALLDLARFAEKSDDFVLYISSLSSVYKYIIEEQKKASDNQLVEYSEQVNGILAKIAKKVGDTSRSDDRYNYVGIVPVIYSNDVEGRISANTFLRMWEMVNRAAKAGNTGWFRDYWTYADQYYRFAIHNMKAEPERDNMKEFYHYQVMIGGLLVYFKRYEWLQHIMHFTQELPAHFALIPGTLTKIFDEVKYLDQLLSKPFGVYQKYQFYGLERGARMDDAIAGFAYQYLSLLIIRLWTYRDYNYNYVDPLELPNADNESIEANDDMIVCVEQIKKNVCRWYDNGLIKELGLKDVAQGEVIQKLDDYIVALKMKIQEISARDEVDKHKADVIKAEMVVTNANVPARLPLINDHGSIDESLYKTVSTPVIATQPIEKPYITKGSKKSIGNFGSCLVTILNETILNDYLSIVFKNIPQTINYNINQKHLLRAIDKLCLPDDYIMVEIGNALDSYELRKEIDYNTIGCEYKGHRILGLGMSAIPPCIWIVKESDLPFAEIMETESTGDDLTEIDGTNHLYSNIEKLQKPYKVTLVQSIKVYILKNISSTCLLTVIYDYGENTYDLDKVNKL